MQDHVLVPRVEPLPRSSQGESELVGEGLGDGLGPAPRLAPWSHRPVAYREGRPRDDQVGIDLHLETQARAGRAHAHRIVEAEELHRHVWHRYSALEAGVLLAEEGFLPGVGVHGPQGPRALAQRCLHRVGEAALYALLYHDAVDHDRDVVLALLFEPDLPVERENLAVDENPHISAPAEVRQQVCIRALAAANHGSRDEQPGVPGLHHQPVDDLLGGLARDCPAAGRAVDLAGPGVQHPEVVGYLRDGAHRGAGVVAHGLLLDCDGGGESFYAFVERLLELAEELPRIRRERFDIPALAFSVERIEGEGALAGPGDAREDHELIPGYDYVDVPEVVLTGSAHHYPVQVFHPSAEVAVIVEYNSC